MKVFSQCIKSLETAENLEADQVKIANQFRVDAARQSAEYNKDYYLTINQTARKEKATKKYNKIRYCYLWNVEGPNGDKALSMQKPVKDPFHGGLNITNNKKRIEELNKICSTTKEPFPKKIIIGFLIIIIIILLVAFFKR